MTNESFVWNSVRCACVLLFITVPAVILGLLCYSVFYSVDLPLVAMSLIATVIVSVAGGLWFAYFDMRYTALLNRCERLIRALEKRL